MELIAFIRAFLSASHLLAALRALVSTGRDDGIPLIAELLSLSACPAGMLLLLKLSVAGSIAASGATMVTKPHTALSCGLAGHAAANLVAGRASVLAAAYSTASVPTLAAAQAPLALHMATLALRIGDVAQRLASPPPLPAATVASTATPPSLSGAAYFLLDIDGTLVHTDDLYRETFKRLLAPYGHVVDDAFYAEHVHGKVDAEVFRSLMPAGTSDADLGQLSKDKDALFCSLYREQAAASGPPMLDGLPEALETARKLGVRGIAVTNAPRGAADECIRSLKTALPVAAAVIADSIVVSAECARAKPHPEPYLEAMRRLGAKPEECVAFEDSRSGVRSAVAAKVRAVIGLRSSCTDDELRALGATTTLENWHGLTEETVCALMKGPPAARRSTGGSDGPVRGLARRASSLSLAASKPLLLGLGLALSAAPGEIARSSLFCRGAGDAQDIVAAATRSLGGSLLLLAAALHSIDDSVGAVSGAHDAADAEAAAAASGSPPLLLASSLLASCTAGVVAMAQDGHAMRPWAQRLLLPPLVLGGVGSTKKLLAAC